MKRGICKFCGQGRDLIGAHIIPKAVFSRVRGDGPPLELITSWSGRAGQKSNGFVDYYLTCGPCDNKFSDSEQYFANYLEDKYDAPGTDIHGKSALIDTSYDYKRFKLALLAIFWRAHQSSSEFFVEARLPESDIAKLKMKLQTGEPGLPTDFPIYVRRFRSSKYHAALPRLIMDPVALGEHDIEFMMLGWHFIICHTPSYGEMFLKPEMLVAIDVQLEGSSEEKDILDLLQKGGHAPLTNR